MFILSFLAGIIVASIGSIIIRRPKKPANKAIADKTPLSDSEFRQLVSHISDKDWEYFRVAAKEIYEQGFRFAVAQHNWLRKIWDIQTQYQEKQLRLITRYQEVIEIEAHEKMFELISGQDINDKLLDK